MYCILMFRRVCSNSHSSMRNLCYLRLFIARFGCYQLYVLVLVLISSCLPFFYQSRTILHRMVQCSTVRACCARIKAVSCQVSRLIAIITNDWSSSSSTKSSSTSASIKSSSSTLIKASQSIILWNCSFHCDILFLDFVRI